MDTLRILITDDEPGMRLGATRALEHFTVHVPDIETDVAFAIEHAETGEAALACLADNPPDILLLDHKLPGISGLQVLDTVAEDKHDLLVIMITAYASIETAVTATKRGAYDFLAKPFTPDELKSTVRKAAIRIMLAKQARRLAEEKRQVRFQFISVLAHELKAPLGAIEGYLQILKDPRMRQDADQVGRMIERSLLRAGAMRKLIYDLLDLTRIESGLKQRDLRSVDLVEAARDALDTLAPDADARGIALVLEAPETLVLTADRSELDIMLNNLVSNAVKYNRDGGRVRVRIMEDAGRITLEVSDTGIGMTEAETQRLFQDFVRIKNVKTRDILGSGLGLSTVKKLARLYGGDATVTSEPDVGSTFTVSLLREAEQEQKPEAGCKVADAGNR
ncbi:MAG: response regulator [Phycisphaerae bacterium]|nr:response regulator [Phycisphaerae bacterium]